MRDYRQSMRDLSLEDIEHWCRYVPWLIVGYFCLQFLTRILVSSNLEVDEAQFVGATDLRLLYANSHPPIYNWLVRLALEITNWSWSIALPLVRNVILLVMYLLAFDLMFLLTRSYFRSAVVIVCLLVLPQIVWQSQVTLAHSVLVACGCVATLHALVLVYQSGRWTDYAWLGLAVTIGFLAKFNYALFLVSMIIAIFLVPHVRKQFEFRKILLSVSIFLVCLIPIIYTAISNLAESSGRIKKLYRSTDYAWFDLPYLGIDGLFSSVGAFLAWAGPLLLMFAILHFLLLLKLPSVGSEQRKCRDVFSNLFGLICLVGVSLFALIILFADMHFVHERYFTPLLMALPFWFVLKFPIVANVQARVGLLRFGLILMLCALIGANSLAMFGNHSLSFPYRDVCKWDQPKVWQ